MIRTSKFRENKMKKLIFISIVLASTSVSAEMVVNSDGSYTNYVGNTAIHSDGSTTTHVGNEYIHSDGSHTTQVGNTYIHSDPSQSSSTQIKTKQSTSNWWDE